MQKDKNLFFQYFRTDSAQTIRSEQILLGLNLSSTLATRQEARGIFGIV